MAKRSSFITERSPSARLHRTGVRRNVRRSGGSFTVTESWWGQTHVDVRIADAGTELLVRDMRRGKRGHARRRAALRDSPSEASRRRQASKFLQRAQNLAATRPPSPRAKESGDVPVSYPQVVSAVASREEIPANHTKPTRGLEPRTLHYE